MSLPKNLLYRPNLPALHFSPNDPIGSRSTGGHLGNIEYKYPAHSHFHSFACYRQQPTSPRRNSLPPSSHPSSGNIQRLFNNNPKIFKDFFACKTVLAANHQHPKTFKDFFACKIVLAANHQLYPGNIQRFSGQQKQKSTAATCSSNQQQQLAAASSSSNQQQQSTEAINNTTSSNNQHLSYEQHLHNHCRRLLVITTVPSRGYVLLKVDLGSAAR